MRGARDEGNERKMRDEKETKRGGNKEMRRKKVKGVEKEKIHFFLKNKKINSLSKKFFLI